MNVLVDIDQYARRLNYCFIRFLRNNDLTKIMDGIHESFNHRVDIDIGKKIE